MPEEQGDLDGALERFHASLAIESALLAKRPDDTSLVRAAASSNNAIGRNELEMRPTATR